MLLHMYQMYQLNSGGDVVIIGWNSRVTCWATSSPRGQKLEPKGTPSPPPNLISSKNADNTVNTVYYTICMDYRYLDMLSKALHNAQSVKEKPWPVQGVLHTCTVHDIIPCKNADCHTHKHKLLHSVHYKW